MPAIQTEHLTKKFGEFTAVKDVNLRVEHGEIFGFLGPNGSGKTTIIKMLAGLLSPTEGSMQICGLDVQRHSEEVREQVGYMSQTFSLYDDLTAMENLQFYAKIYGLSAKQRRERIADIIECNSLDRYLNCQVRTLSGGWKQRLALGCAMIHQPKVMFLDEPTAGIDPVARRRLWDLIFDLSGRGITFFVTTHYMDEAERCSHVAYLYYGTLIADGTPESLGSLPEVNIAGTRRVAITANDVTRALKVSRTLPLIKSATIFGRSIHAVVSDHASDTDIIREMGESGVRVTDVRALEVSLEDVFVDLTCRYETPVELSHA